MNPEILDGILIFDLVVSRQTVIYKLTTTMQSYLIAHAEGAALDSHIVAALERCLLDYADCELEGDFSEAAKDIEALTRHSRSVARLVAARIDEQHLHKRICTHIHGRVYGEERLEIERLIISIPELAELVRRLKHLKADAETAFRSVEDERASREIVRLVRGRRLSSEPAYKKLEDLKPRQSVVKSGILLRSSLWEA